MRTTARACADVRVRVRTRGLSPKAAAARVARDPAKVSAARCSCSSAPPTAYRVGNREGSLMTWGLISFPVTTLSLGVCGGA